MHNTSIVCYVIGKRQALRVRYDTRHQLLQPAIVTVAKYAGCNPAAILKCHWSYTVGHLKKLYTARTAGTLGKTHPCQTLVVHGMAFEGFCMHPPRPFPKGTAGGYSIRMCFVPTTAVPLRVGRAGKTQPRVSSRVPLVPNGSEAHRARGTPRAVLSRNGCTPCL